MRHQAAAGARPGKGENTGRGRPGPEVQLRHQGVGQLVRAEAETTRIRQALKKWTPPPPLAPGPSTARAISTAYWRRLR